METRNRSAQSKVALSSKTQWELELFIVIDEYKEELTDKPLLTKQCQTWKQEEQLKDVELWIL